MFMDRRAPREFWHTFFVLGRAPHECDKRNGITQLKRDKSDVRRLYNG